ncbi:unnamed protein product [Parnassius apollo]|uniref:(apollo) hypothetical protein n=1 Tax=Parnassius apollo TaxID=110799 RepID=A0A8S3X7W3_PARAO|nr:unnamed protein product [Parnassius apollo]
MEDFDDDLDYELSQLDLSEYNQECNTLSNSDTLQVFDVDLNETISIARTKNHHRWQILSDSEDDQIPILPPSRNTEVWFIPLGKQSSIIPYTECPGLKPFSLRSSMSSAKPAEFYLLLVPDSIFKYIAEETNRFALQTLNKSATKSYRMQKWMPTDCH